MMRSDALLPLPASAAGLALTLFLLAATPAGAQQTGEPDRFAVELPELVLVYQPGGGQPQLSAGGTVLSYGSRWEVRRIHPYLYQLRHESWDDLFWEVNTSRRHVFSVRNATFGQLGGDDERLDAAVRPDGNPEDPVRFTLRFQDAVLIHSPARGRTQISSGGSGIVSRGENWEVRQLKSYLYHLRHRVWRDFFWQVNTSRQEVYRVTGGDFGELGGAHETLALGVEVYGVGEEAAPSPEGGRAGVDSLLAGIRAAAEAVGGRVGEQPPAGGQAGTERTAFGGRWKSSRGQLRLHQFDSYVVGSWEKGVILGKVSGDCVAGIFTEEQTNGKFRFRKDGEDSFQGRWGRRPGHLATATWSGTRVSEGSPSEYAGFTRDGSTTSRMEDDRTVYDGEYETPRGSVKLLGRDGFLVGDFDDVGVLVGMWDGGSFVGRFTRWRQTGWFDFRFSPERGAFQRGTWGWVGDSSGGGEWTLNRTARGTPQLDNMLSHISCR